MRIDQVRAGAFGPLHASQLNLAPGLTVVHGPNEAGKSSWFAATYAGLVGRRKARGRGTTAQAAFAQRHKPWSGTRWAAGVTVTLDDHSQLALEHDLRAGEGRILDPATGRPLSPVGLERRLGRAVTTDGALDGARLLGLNRDVARATIFVAQADVLRVLQDAAELQELLERVATSANADATAEAALQWLAHARSERVGVAHIGNRPLRQGTLAASEARQAATQARDQLAQLLHVLTAQRDITERLQRAAATVEQLERGKRWLAVEQLQRRVDQARQLTGLLAEQGEPPADDALVSRVTTTLAGYDQRPQPTPLPEGPDAVTLRQELEQLPEMPDGDLEPRPEIAQARDALTQARVAWLTHHQSVPTVPDTPAVAATAEQLRDLATRLDATAPEVDPELERQVVAAHETHAAAMAAYASATAEHQAAVERNRQAQQAYEANLAAYRREQDQYASAMRDYDTILTEQERRRADHAAQSRGASTASRTLLIGGGVVAAVGILLFILGQGLAGVLLLVLGAALAGAGLLRRPRATSTPQPVTQPAPPHPVAPTPPDAPTFEPADPPMRPEADPHLADQEVRLAAQRLAVETHRRHRADAEAELRRLELPWDSAELRRLARALDDADDARQRATQHAAQAKELAHQRHDARARLITALNAAVNEDGDEEERDQAALRAYDAYVAKCRQRAQQANAAARRTDLQQALEQRLEREELHHRARAERHQREAAAVALATELGVNHPAAEASAEAEHARCATALRDWLTDQEARRAHAATQAQRNGRLEELLAGRSLDELEQDLIAEREDLGPAPDDVPADLEDQLVTWTRRRDGLLGQAGDLRGQQSQLTANLPPVAQTLEQEASAQRNLTQVQEFAGALELATIQLERAKERSHASVAPTIERTIRPWIPRVTRGRYVDVKVSPADLTMKVTEANGAVRDAHLLSHGTTEQLYLLLRVALAQHLASAEETAPLILDDVTVQSDRERTWAVLDLLHEVSEQRQVVLFTQEDEVLAWAQRELREPQDLLVSLPSPRS